VSNSATRQSYTEQMKHVRSYTSQLSTNEEIYEVLGVTVYMGGGPALMYATPWYRTKTL